MDCPTENILRAYIDLELDPHEISKLKAHLQTCASCRERCQILSDSALRVSSKLAALEAPPSALEANPHAAFARFRASLSVNEHPVPFFARIFSVRYRFAWAASFAATILIISLMFPTTRSFAQRLLATLRVEQVKTINIDLEPMTAGANRQPLETLSKLLSDTVVMTTNEKSSSASSRSAASQAAGFPVRLLATRADTPAFQIAGAHAFHFTLDRSRLQDILDEAGHSDLLLPATLDGATVSVQVPRAVAVQYGTCKKDDQQSASPSTAPSNASANSCLMLLQAPSPIVNVPSDLNIQQLAEIGLQLTGWSAVKAREFCQTVDWKSTLVLPIPRTVQSYETVNVNGVRGTLMHFPDSSTDHPSYALVWVEGGVIYSIVGKGDSASALQLASSLQ